MTTSTSQPDYDSPWKEIIEQYFPEFMRFFFPQAYEEIDWSRPHTFLDKELQKIMREAETGNRRVDKLVKVFLQNGRETWLLLHIEVQGQWDGGFEERIYIYHYRIFDRYQKQVVSLAILTDDSPNWRPGQYGYDRWGCRLSLDFPIIKLLDYKQDELVASDNPFGIVVLAHLQTMETRHKPQKRYAAKLKLAKMLYQRGYTRQDILELFRFIDWIMTLPDELAQQFDTELYLLDEESNMKYVTSFERRAIQKGRQEGRQEGIWESIIELLTIRFGSDLDETAVQLKQINDVDTLRALRKQAITADSLQEFMQSIPSVS
ncbi:MAG: transposase [Aquificales bacterium]|nr:transposase [Aquificales bacterium]